MKNILLILFSGLFGVFGIENSSKITEVVTPLVASNYAPATDVNYSDSPILLADKEQSQEAQNISITPNDINNTKSVLEIVVQVVISIASLLGIFKNWKKKKPIEEIEVDEPEIINFKK